MVSDLLRSSDLGCASTSPSFQTRPRTAKKDLLVRVTEIRILPNDGVLQMNWVGLKLFVVYGPSLQSVSATLAQF